MELRRDLRVEGDRRVDVLGDHLRIARVVVRVEDVAHQVFPGVVRRRGVTRCLRCARLRLPLLDLLGRRRREVEASGFDVRRDLRCRLQRVAEAGTVLAEVLEDHAVDAVVRDDAA
jgi:hypothetical protein